MHSSIREIKQFLKKNSFQNYSERVLDDTTTTNILNIFSFIFMIIDDSNISEKRKAPEILKLLNLLDCPYPLCKNDLMFPHRKESHASIIKVFHWLIQSIQYAYQLVGNKQPILPEEELIKALDPTREAEIKELKELECRGKELDDELEVFYNKERKIAELKEEIKHISARTLKNTNREHLEKILGQVESEISKKKNEINKARNFLSQMCEDSSDSNLEVSTPSVSQNKIEELNDLIDRNKQACDCIHDFATSYNESVPEEMRIQFSFSDELGVMKISNYDELENMYKDRISELTRKLDDAYCRMFDLKSKLIRSSYFDKFNSGMVDTHRQIQEEAARQSELEEEKAVKALELILENFKFD